LHLSECLHFSKSLLLFCRDTGLRRYQRLSFFYEVVAFGDRNGQRDPQVYKKHSDGSSVLLFMGGEYCTDVSLTDFL